MLGFHLQKWRKRSNGESGAEWSLGFTGQEWEKVVGGWAVHSYSNIIFDVTRLEGAEEGKEGRQGCAADTTSCLLTSLPVSWPHFLSPDFTSCFSLHNGDVEFSPLAVSSRHLHQSVLASCCGRVPSLSRWSTQRISPWIDLCDCCCSIFLSLQGLG